MWIHTNIHHSLHNENLRGGYGLREAYGSENLMLGSFLAGFGKTNARAPTIAGLVWPRHLNITITLTKTFLALRVVSHLNEFLVLTWMYKPIFDLYLSSLRCGCLRFLVFIRKEQGNFKHQNKFFMFNLNWWFSLLFQIDFAHLSKQFFFKYASSGKWTCHCVRESAFSINMYVRARKTGMRERPERVESPGTYVTKWV